MPTPTRLVIGLLLIFVSGPALGQESAQGADKATEGAAKSSAKVSLVEFVEVMTAAGCKPEAIGDPRFVADAKNAIRPLIHDEDARAMLTNKKHVLYAYVALLVLFIGFVAFLFERQRRLALEIASLEADLADALKADEP